ncbi:MAG: DUF2330 domain-containing protein [Myxococcales bacterium]|nr:DUF2330 domain-containing protein [Myxococcales bacterium]
MKRFLAAAAFAAAFGVSASASAFCGFYVSGADQKLFNNATQVVLMREGSRTVLSMENNYQGPPQNFAMVVPVPVVLQKENVKTLPRAIFEHVDTLAAPRLVEYWEQDPCMVMHPHPLKAMGGMAAGAPRSAAVEKDKADLGVRVEAQFTVGEYEIVVLSAQDSGGLDTWLKREGYKIPDGAEPYLRPYVQQGSKFFVAKVDVTKVKFEGGMAKLSPLRFHYDAERFSLPIRLGLMNSKEAQDLIVHILAQGTRYEVANYQNVAIPTNLDVKDSARGSFGSFYASLFDKTLEKYPRAVVTEYSWDASTCDPCPSPALSPSEISTLGADVLPSAEAQAPQPGGVPMKGRWMPRSGYVLTRLHARYTKDNLGDDLVFRTAPPIVGGREHVRDGSKLEEGAVQDSVNNFQGRYAIRHAWTGPIKCANPRRGIWGGPPGGNDPRPQPALNLAFAARNKAGLPGFLAKGLPESSFSSLGAAGPLPPPVPLPTTTAAVTAVASSSPPPPEPDAGSAPVATADAGAADVKPVEPSNRGCGCNEAPASGSLAFLGLGIAAALGVAARRRSR